MKSKELAGFILTVSGFAMQLSDEEFEEFQRYVYSYIERKEMEWKVREIKKELESLPYDLRQRLLDSLKS